MTSKAAGYAWLANYYSLPEQRLRSLALVGGKALPTVLAEGKTLSRYTAAYWPGERPFDHLTFALKHEPIQLDILADIFKRLDPVSLLSHIKTTPSGRYARIAGFLYEWFTRIELAVDFDISGGYVPVLHPKAMLAPKGQRVPRWRVLNNLSGTPDFCPVIRRTVLLESFLSIDFSARIASYRRTINPRLFERAIGYLYQKETRSSFAIEHETLSPGRAGLFLSALTRAGLNRDLLTETGLIELQRAILDPRYVESKFRRTQNYVGESLPGYREKIHYVCPPPQFVYSLMNGLKALPEAVAGIEPLAEAAMISFGFVFIHPFEDGNGRIHRFLIHDVLARRAVLPRDIIIPVSAYMDRQRALYDAALEQFSSPLLRNVQYELDDVSGKMVITNSPEIESYFRYPDFTSQAEFLGRALRSSIEDDLLEEVDFLQKFDKTTELVRQIVDLPDKKLSLLIRLMHAQGGRLSHNKRRTQFSELTDDEVTGIQFAFSEGFGTTRDIWSGQDDEIS